MRRRDETVGPQLSPSVMPEPNTTQVSGGSVAASGDFARQLQASRGRPLPPALRERFEGKLGADFGGVRVHTDAAAGRLSRAIQAQAFTRGQDIFVGAGHYAPGTAAGQRLLAHELAHVVQQGAAPAQGAVGPSRAPQLAVEPGSAIQRKLDWQNTEWEKAGVARVSKHGARGTLFVKEHDIASEDSVILKTGESSAEAVLAANLRKGATVGKWTMVAPGARVVETEEGKKIQRYVTLKIKTDNWDSNDAQQDIAKTRWATILEGVAQSGAVVYEYAPGKDLSLASLSG